MKSKHFSDVCNKCNHTFRIGEGRYLFQEEVLCSGCHQSSARVRPRRPNLTTVRQRMEATDHPKEVAG